MTNTSTIRNRTLPAEWDEQSGVMLTWPHDATDWAPILADVEPVYLNIAREVCKRERLVICARDERHADHIHVALGSADVDSRRVRIGIAHSNDSWVRDHGPITVMNKGNPELLDFVFNGWGGKYAAELDDAITRSLHADGVFGKTPVATIPLVLEGGGIESDGAGTLLTTRQCLLSRGRNPHLTETQIESELKNQLGVHRLLWLSHGHLEGDDTDSHIDTLARFCDARTIAYVQCDDPSDPHHADLSAMEDELRLLRDAHGQPYRLVPLPWPKAKHNADGKRLPATYANFLIINGAVLLPTYRDVSDSAARSRLQECFPNREVIPIDCLPLIHQFGSLHCITMQLPVGVLPPL